jgi:hypothetical protein
MKSIFRLQVYRPRLYRSVHWKSHQFFSTSPPSQPKHKIYQIYENGDRKQYTWDCSEQVSLKPMDSVSGKKDGSARKSPNLMRYFRHTLQQLLPYGYPISVNDGYARFALGQFVASTLGTICGVLSMQSLFHAVGVGSNSTLPFAAALNWIIKDGLGQLGGVLFASAVNSKFDADPKRWRFIAAFSLDFSCFIELLSPLAPGYFLLIASTANVGKNISYLAASASRAAIHKSFAVHENLADVTAKTGSQTILASLIGTSLGISAASMIGGDFYGNLLLFCACSSSGLAATYFSLHRVIINTLTASKLDSIYQGYLEKSVILTPCQLMEKEVLLGSPANIQLPRAIIGCDLHEAIPSTDNFLVSIAYGDTYIL